MKLILKLAIVTGMLSANLFAQDSTRKAVPWTVTDGDSITAGYWYSLGPDSYPGQMGASLNLGVAGATSFDVLTKHLPLAVPLVRRTDVWWYVLLIGANDKLIGVSESLTQFYIRNIVLIMHNAGAKVMLLTQPPGNLTDGPPDYEEWRVQHNAWLPLAGADSVCDSGNDAVFLNQSGPFFSPDHFHPSKLGYGVIASRVHNCLEATQ